MSPHEQFRIILLIALFSFTSIGNAGAGSSAYTFSVNGEPVSPQHYSLNADASVFAPGDVIYVGDKKFNYGGLFMTLGEEKDCRFVTLTAQAGTVEDDDSASRAPVKDGRVFLELADGRRKVVGVIVTRSFRRKPADANGQKEKGKISFEETLVNPLDSMSPEEIHGLWGIYLSHWPEGTEEKLTHVNTDRICIALSDDAGVGGRKRLSLAGPSLPPIPPKIRYLVVRESMSPGLSDFSRLSQFRDLAFLKFETMHREPLDITLICQNTSMRYLDLSGCAIENYPKLASLTELRFLNISGSRDIEDIEFVQGMHQLRRLLMGRTRVPSLSPLDGSDSIREIYAGMTNVSVLPKGGLGSLRTINLVASNVDAQAVEQFRKAHPACTVQYGWVDSLRKAVQGTTRLRVRSGGTCHRRIEEETTLVEITDAREIDRFLRGIVIDESRSGGACMCCGNPTFEFYAGERLLAMIGYHHGESLRWARGEWTGDGQLTVPSQDFVSSWLSQHGVEGPRREREEKQRQLDQRMRQQQRYAELIPREMLAGVMEAQSSRQISWSDDTTGEKRKKLIADAFLKHETDARTSAALYLRMLGVTREEPWNTYDYFDEIVVKHLLPRFKGPELAQAAVDVMKDEEGTAGAARWFLGESGWRNLDESDRERVLSPLARQALQHRYLDTRKEVMNVLSEINSTWAVESLRGMLSRPTDPNWAPPKLKYGWKIDLPGGNEVYADECSDAVWAAFCLARIGNVESLPAIQKLAEESQERDKDLLNKALQLLRDKASKMPADTK